MDAMDNASIRKIRMALARLTWWAIMNSPDIDPACDIHYVGTTHLSSGPCLLK